MSPPLAGKLVATDWGSPSGVTTTAHLVHELWAISYYLALPIGAIVFGGIMWCVIRYRRRPGDDSIPKQFQYHIPIEVAYTVIPLIVVAVLFGFVYGAENKIDNLNKHPAVKITVLGFQWGWRFTYPNGHEELGSDYTLTNNAELPTLYIPAGETVQFRLESADVNHSFYVPEFLFQRDMIQGINNVVDINVEKNKTGTYIGECTQLCGTYHAFMRFEVDVLSQKNYQSWYAGQAPNSIHCVGGSC